MSWGWCSPRADSALDNVGTKWCQAGLLPVCLVNPEPRAWPRKVLRTRQGPVPRHLTSMASIILSKEGAGSLDPAPLRARPDPHLTLYCAHQGSPASHLTWLYLRFPLSTGRNRLGGCGGLARNHTGGPVFPGPFAFTRHHRVRWHARLSTG